MRAKRGGGPAEGGGGEAPYYGKGEARRHANYWKRSDRHWERSDLRTQAKSKKINFT